MLASSTSQPLNLGLLRRALQADGLFCAVSGLALLLDAAPIARFLGIGGFWPLAGVGVVLLGYAAMLFRDTLQPVLNPQLGRTVALLNVAWVVASVIILLSGWLPLTTEGKWAIAIVADIVATFALVQFYALRRGAR